MDAVPPIRDLRGRPRRKPRRLYADRGYGFDKYRRPLWKRGINPMTCAAYADLYAGTGDRAHPLASPVFADLTGLPPLLVQVGANEVLLDDAVRLAGRAGADDVEVTLEVGPGPPHVFQHHYEHLDEADAALDRATRFLTAHLGAGHPGADRPERAH